MIARKNNGTLKVSNVTIMLYDPFLDELTVSVVKGIQVPVGLRLSRDRYHGGCRRGDDF